MAELRTHLVDIFRWYAEFLAAGNGAEFFLH
jgi:hypothetical protein